MAAPRYKLKLSRLDFISPVDEPAQQTAKVLLIKRDGAASGFARVAKIDEKLGLVFCWAFTSTVNGADYHDLQGDAVEYDFVKAAADFMSGSRALDEMHNRKPGEGLVVFAMPMTPEIAKAYGVTATTTGLMVALKPTPEVLAKFVSGEYTGVSIDGEGYRTPVDKAKKPRRKKLMPQAPDSATSYKRVGKQAVLTSETDGHQHGIGLEDPADCYSDALTTTYAMAEGAAQSHCHAWVYDQATGAITVAMDSGHTHTVTAVVPPEVIAEAALGDDDGVPCAVSDEPSSGKTSVVVVSARAPAAPAGDSPPSGAGRNVGVTSQEQHPMDPKIAKALSLALSLPEPQRAHVAKLAPDDQIAFLALDGAARAIAVTAAEAADPVVHTTKSGIVLRKSAGELAVSLAKMADAQAEQLTAQAELIAKANAATEQVSLEKRAGEVLSHFAKGIGVHAAILRAVDGIADENIRKDAIEALKGANAGLVEVGKVRGYTPKDGPDAQPTAYSKMRTAVEVYAKANNLTYPVALERATATDPTIRDLYNQAQAGN